MWKNGECGKMFKFIQLTGGSVDPDTWGKPCTPRADMIYNIQSMVDLHPNPKDPENLTRVPVRVVWCYEGMFKVQETLEVIQAKITEALQDKSDKVFIKSKSTPQQHEQFTKIAQDKVPTSDKVAQDRFIAAANRPQEQRAIPYQPAIPAAKPEKKGVLAGLFNKGSNETYD
jgi:hypothetical protein